MIVTDQILSDIITESKGAFLTSAADQAFKDKLVNIPMVHRINNRLKTLGGRATWKKATGVYVVEVNPKVHHNGTVSDLKNTVKHEMAHCLQHSVRGKSDHGTEWKALHRCFGGNGERCHYIPLKGISGRDWLYVNLTSGKAFWITAKRAKGALRSDNILIMHKSDPCTLKYSPV